MNLDQLWDELASDLEREFRGYRSQLRNLDVTVKADSTLLTNADIAVENLIIDRIRKVDPNPVVVAEEDVRTAVRQEILDDPARIWVIDPIEAGRQVMAAPYASARPQADRPGGRRSVR
jgi:3'(2'), 5'-bisphosphate nucleotidase